jgi:hypothetical protein
MNARTWMTLAGICLAAALCTPAGSFAADDDFSELLDKLKPAKPILPPTTGCAACEKLGHICPVCKERALRALAEGREIPTEPPKVLPDEHNPPPAMPGRGENPLVPVAKMMKEVEEELKTMASKRAQAKHQEVLDALDKQLREAIAKQKQLLEKMNREMGDARGGQKRIVDYLDALIAQAEQQQQGSGSGSGSGSGQGQGQGQGSSGPPSGTNQPSSPAQNSALVQGGDRGIGELQDMQRGSGERWWAELPQAKRDAIIAAYRQRYPDRWREMLEGYYRALSQIRRQDRDRNP